MTNAPKWFNHVNAIFATIGTGSYKPLQDQITWQVMARVVPGLMSKAGVNGGLLEGFITNIRARGGDRSFDFQGPLVLTRHQRQHARRMGWDVVPSLDELRARNGGGEPVPECGLDADWVRVDAELWQSCQQSIRFQSAVNQQSISNQSAFLPRNLAEKLGSWVLNEMKWNEMKHEPDGMIRPADDVMLASSPDDSSADANQAAITSPGHDEQGAHRDVGGSHRQGDAHRGNGDEEAGPVRATVSWFHNDAARPPSANLELGDRRFSLVFSDSDIAEGVLSQHSSPTWLKDFDDAGGAHVRRESRAAGNGKTRYRLSPLYEAKDTFGRKPPAHADAVAVLMWNEDEQPEQVLVLVGTDWVEVPLSKHHSRNPKAPPFKGSVEIKMLEVA